MIPNLLFIIFSSVMLFSALMVISLQHPVRSALFLVVCFFSATGLWLLLSAEFLALILVLVYVGAVMTLFLFVVMTISMKVVNKQEGFVRYLPFAALILLLIVGFIIMV